MPAPWVIQRSDGILTGRDGDPVAPLELSLAVTTTRQFFAVNSNHFANSVSGEPQVELIQSWLVALARQVDFNRAV